MNEVFYWPLELDKSALCFYNEIQKDDDDHFGCWTPSLVSSSTSSFSSSSTSSSTYSSTGDLRDTDPMSGGGGDCGGPCGELDDTPSSPLGHHQKSLWMRWLSTFMRFRRLRQKMLKKEVGCLQRLRHRLRRLKKVLYVCEGMSGRVGEAMAAAQDRATSYRSVQQDTTLGLPIQVAHPDGEERHYTLPSMKHLATSDSQEAEITREYIKPPPNRSLFDVEGEGPHRSYSMGVFPQTEWGVVQGGMHHHSHHHHHRPSASLDAKPTHPAVSVASSSSSSWSSFGSGDESNRESPRRGRKTVGFGQRGSQLIANCSALFTSPKNERAPQSPQDGSRRTGRHQGSLLPSHDHYCPTANTLADITMVSVPCGSSNSPSYPGGSGVSQGTLVGSGLGVQGDLSLSFEQSSQSGCSATADHDLPPLYSEVIENPTLYPSDSRPEQRTRSGKI